MSPVGRLPALYEDVTPAERKEARREYILLQEGCCWHCGGNLDGPTIPWEVKPVNKKLFPEGFFDWPIHLHHDHKTGLTIGAVHALCNAILWEHHGQ